MVVSVTIDDAVARFLPEATTVIVKLDIEGAEPNGLAGASRTRRSRDCLFIVEDHGSDKQHHSAAACFAEGLKLWLLGASSIATPMPDLAAVPASRQARTWDTTSSRVRKAVGLPSVSGSRRKRCERMSRCACNS
jgi:hypothetical protein